MHRGHAHTRAHALCGAHTRAGARAHTWGTGLEQAGMCSLPRGTHLDTLLGHRCDVCVTYGHTAVLRTGACPWSAHRAQQHRHTHVCTHCMCDAQICCVSAGLPTSSILSLVLGWKRDGLLSSSLPAGVTHPSAGVGSSAWPQPAGNGSALHTKEVTGQEDRGKLGFRATVCSPGTEMCFHCGGRAHLFCVPMSMEKQRGEGTGSCWLVRNTKEDSAGCSTC